jgi:IS30 family transposase
MPWTPDEAKKYNKRKGKNSGRGLIPNRVDIDQRPSVVAAKSRIGDWEAEWAHRRTRNRV